MCLLLGKRRLLPDPIDSSTGGYLSPNRLKTTYLHFRTGTIVLRICFSPGKVPPETSMFAVGSATRTYVSSCGSLFIQYHQPVRRILRCGDMAPSPSICLPGQYICGCCLVNAGPCLIPLAYRQVVIFRPPDMIFLYQSTVIK